MRHIETFDIFDTVLTRRVGDPRAAFLQLGQRLVMKGLITCSAESFSRQRTAAEQRAFRNAGGLDSAVTIDTIYREMRVSLGIDSTMHGKLLAEELDLESDLLVPMSDGVRRVKHARDAGFEVAFVSDMYLPSWFLRQTLAKFDLIQPDDVLLVSCEQQASKATGALWPKVLRELDVAPGQLHHTGNDLKSDVKSPRKAGIRSTHVPAGNLNRYELALESHAFETGGLTSLLAGASRRTRTEMPVKNEHEASLRDVSAGVIAPFLVGNVLWILRQAIESHTEKVFFVARDGQLMLDVARELAPKIGYTGDLAYLQGSRSAWLLPSLTSLDDDKICSAVPLAGDVDGVTVRVIMHRFGLEPESLEHALSNAGFGADSWDVALSAEVCAQLRTALRSPDLHDAILEIAEERRAVMLAYLEQEGVVTSAPIAIVDQGTGSTLFNAISTVLQTVGQRPPQGFYFGLREDAADQGFGYPETYIRNELSSSGFLKTPGLLTLVEMACTADHGSVTGYEHGPEGIQASLTQATNEPIVEWGFDVMRAAVSWVARELCAIPADLPGHVDLRPASLSVFELFWTSPTKTEAVAWGRYPFEDGWAGDNVTFPIAERQGVGATIRKQPHRHWWNSGAEALSGPVPRAMLRGRSHAIDVARKVSRRLG